MNIIKATPEFSIANSQTKGGTDLTKEELEKELKVTRKKLGKLQDTMFAHGKYAVLICLQGMDTAGKDSLIREVFKGFNVRGVTVHSFKTPTNLEKNHDYLWRHYIALPERGKFGEKSIAQNGTLIFKFFLNISKEEQKNRLIRRLEKQEKNWKFSAGDLKERKLWDEYQKAYEIAIKRTSKPHAPWYVVPADNKPEARLLVAQTIYDKLKEYSDIKEPSLPPDVESQLSKYLSELNNEK